MATLRIKLSHGSRASLAAGLLIAACGAARAAEIWCEKTPMLTGRLWHASSVVDGKIYAIGGRATETLTTEYDPATDTWTTKTPMPTPRFAHSTSAVDGKIYAIGGVRAAYTSPLSIVEEYDPVTDSWATKAPMPTTRCGHATSVVDGKIYAIGGGGSSALWGSFRHAVEAYDPITDTWSKRADMPTARIMFSTSVVEGKIYAIGGVLVTKAGLSTVEVYDPVTDTWTTKTPMPTARHAHASAVVDGKIYIIGGGPEGGANHAGPDGLSVVEAYDPATDTWTTKADMPEPRGLLSASVVDGTIYVIGGKTTTKNPHPPGLSTVYEYTPDLQVVDFNGDGMVDGKDVLIMTAHWGEDDPFYDIGPTPFGDGVVDVEDVIVLAKHIGKEVDDPTLFAHWAFDETEGTVAQDDVGGSDGTVRGNVGWQPDGGKVGGALEFDGATVVTTDFVLDPGAAPFSVLAWVKSGLPGQVIVSQRGGANWLTIDPATGTLVTELCGGRQGGPLYSDAIIITDDWHRVGLAWDGSNRSLYVDDILVSEDTQTGLTPSDRGLNIGCGKDQAPATYFTGLIDDVRMYNRAVKP